MTPAVAGSIGSMYVDLFTALYNVSMEKLLTLALRIYKSGG